MTPEYASPEQVRGQPLTTASDVYQLGYLLYCLLTGQAPYRRDRQSVADMVRVICDVPPARPSQVVQAEPDDDDVRDKNGAARNSTPERAVKFLSRNKAGVAAAALIIVSIAAGTGATAWQAHAASREARRAEAALTFLTGLFDSVDPDVTLGETVTAKELLDRGADKLNDGLTEAPLLRAEMLGVVGGMYVNLGLYPEARPLLTEARNLLKAAGQDGTDDLAKSADLPAILLYEQGEYEAAEEAARESLAIRRNHLGAEPGFVAEPRSSGRDSGCAVTAGRSGGALPAGNRHRSANWRRGDAGKASRQLWRHVTYRRTE